MNYQDARWNPWPREGSTIEFRFRKGIWLHHAEPWYGDYTTEALIEQPKATRGYFPFLTYRSKRFHFYIGWKPIPAQYDPKFFWYHLLPKTKRGPLYFQLSARYGYGDTV